MTHEQAVEAAIDALGGGGADASADASADAELRAHLASCAACRDEVEALRALWADMGRLPVPAPRPSSEAGAERVRLAGAAEAERRRARRPYGLRIAAAAAVALAASLAASFAVGVALGRRQAPRAAPAAEAGATDGRQSFLLLLHESADFDAGATPEASRALVAEYRDWAVRLRAEGRMAAAEKLADDGGRWLRGEANTAPADTDVVSGFFVIRARDYAEAAELARGCPHLRHGGTVELRLIEPT